MTLFAIGNALRMAFSQLWRNRTRTTLTSLGILIGVASVIAMVGIGQGATRSIQDDLSSFGTNLLLVEPGTGDGPQARTPAPPFDMADVDAVRARITGVRGVAPSVSANETVSANGATVDTSVTGTSVDYLVVRDRTIAEGRAFSEDEARSGAAVCVLGETVREALFGGRSAVGAVVRVGKVPCEVVGVLKAEGESMMGLDQDDLVLMPIRTAQRRLVGSTEVTGIAISVARAAEIDAIRADLDAVMRERRSVASDATVNYTIRDTREMAATMGRITDVLTAFLACVAGVSLLVGGIGIMNIMLVSVTERTREIGIRMAIGALESDIRVQFLVEAAVLAGFGGVLGALLGVGGTVLVATLTGLPLVLNGWVILLSVGFSAAMGIGFGWVPARNAARLEPIDALRHA